MHLEHSLWNAASAPSAPQSHVARGTMFDLSDREHRWLFDTVPPGVRSQLVLVPAPGDVHRGQ